MKVLTEGEVLNKAAAYCSMAEHCYEDVRVKLTAWGVELDVQERILKRLVDENFIDNERYCRFFVNDKLKFNKWGKMKISQALYLKKIPVSISGKQLDLIDEKEYMEILHSLLVSKKKSIRASDQYQLATKLIRFALSRGFEIDTIHKCMKLPDEY